MQVAHQVRMADIKQKGIVLEIEKSGYQRQIEMVETTAGQHKPTVARPSFDTSDDLVLKFLGVEDFGRLSNVPLLHQLATIVGLSPNKKNKKTTQWNQGSNLETCVCQANALELQPVQEREDQRLW
jgi:hypothetical protein